MSSEVKSTNDVLACFKEQDSSVLHEKELCRWWDSKERKGALCDCLEQLVDSNILGTRTIATGETTTKVYWLKEQAQSLVSPAATRPRSKRLRSSFVSPLIKDSQEKRPKLDVISSTDNIKGRLNFGSTCPESSRVTSFGGEEDHLTNLRRERGALLSQLNERKEKLRKLRMVKMYRTKNDLQGLDELTRKWREVAQEAAQCLLESSTSHPPPSMQQLLQYLHIEPELIHYSVDEESFY